jgi:hypothetical protein
VACHHPLAPGSAPEQYLAWNYQAVLAVLEQHAGGVLALLCINPFSSNVDPVISDGMSTTSVQQ